MPRKAAVAANVVYQFVIELIDSDPPIWRRIQVKDCTLDKFHEHIQTAMGWTNGHLHQFIIERKVYGDPEFLNGGFEDDECVDSTRTLLSEVLPKRKRKSPVIKYEYDFGDGWEHDIFFEGSSPADPKAKYPQCIEGEGACPPEDCGGIWRYGYMLDAIQDPEHEQHASLSEWLGEFDPDEFDPKKATTAMRQGLPNWRD